MSEWIDVETELPPDNVKVFINVADPRNIVGYIGVGYHNRNGWFDKSGQLDKDGKIEVLQWMERDAAMFEEDAL